MQASIFPGMTFTQTLDVEDRPRAGHPSAAAMVPTSMAVAFVEWACGEALQPYLDDGERSVGTRIAFEHEAIAPVGPISAHVELIGIEGRRLRFKVVAEDSERVIGRGLHERLVIDEGRMRRPRKPAAGCYSAACM